MTVRRIGEADMELLCIDLRLHDSLTCRERFSLRFYDGHLLSVRHEDIVGDLGSSTDSPDLDASIGDMILPEDTSRRVDSPSSTREYRIDELGSGFGFVACHI